MQSENLTHLPSSQEAGPEQHGVDDLFRTAREVTEIGIWFKTFFAFVIALLKLEIDFLHLKLALKLALETLPHRSLEVWIAEDRLLQSETGIRTDKTHRPLLELKRWGIIQVEEEDRGYRYRIIVNPAAWRAPVSRHCKEPVRHRGKYVQRRRRQLSFEFAWHEVNKAIAQIEFESFGHAVLGSMEGGQINPITREGGMDGGEAARITREGGMKEGASDGSITRSGGIEQAGPAPNEQQSPPEGDSPAAIAESLEIHSHIAVTAMAGSDREIKVRLLHLAAPWTDAKKEELLELARLVGGGSFISKGKDYRPFWISRCRTVPEKTQQGLLRAISDKMEERLTAKNPLALAATIVDERSGRRYGGKSANAGGRFDGNAGTTNEGRAAHIASTPDTPGPMPGMPGYEEWKKNFALPIPEAAEPKEDHP